MWFVANTQPHSCSFIFTGPELISFELRERTTGIRLLAQFRYLLPVRVRIPRKLRYYIPVFGAQARRWVGRLLGAALAVLRLYFSLGLRRNHTERRLDPGIGKWQQDFWIFERFGGDSYAGWTRPIHFQEEILGVEIKPNDIVALSLIYGIKELKRSIFSNWVIG